jgi:hypothetical protein
MTTTMARTLNQGLGLCASLEEAGACIDREFWSIAEVLAISYPVIREAQPVTYRYAM